MIRSVVIWSFLATTPAAAASFTFTTVDYPGAAATNVLGMNASGTLVGSYAQYLPDYMGFVYASGVFTSIPTSTGLVAINDSGLAAGTLSARGDTPSALLTYNIGSGATTTYPPPKGVKVVVAAGLDAAGDVAGTYERRKKAGGDYLRL